MSNLLRDLAELESHSGSGVPPFHAKLALRWACTVPANGPVVWTELPEGTTTAAPYSKRPNKPEPRLLCDVAEYAVGCFTEGGRRPFAARHLAAFVALLDDVLVAAAAVPADGGLPVAEIRRIRDRLAAGPIDRPAGMEAQDLVAFCRADGTYLHDDPAVRAFWTGVKTADVLGGVPTPCCACGRSRKPVRKVTEWIRGVPGSQANNCAIVTNNMVAVSSAERIGHPQVVQAGLCFECASQSHKALNALLDAESEPIFFGPTVTVSWPADTTDKYGGPDFLAVRTLIRGLVDGTVPDYSKGEASAYVGRVRVVTLAAHQARGIIRRDATTTAADLVASATRFYGPVREAGLSTPPLRSLVGVCLPPEVRPTLAFSDRAIGALLFGEALPVEFRDARRRLVQASSAY